MGKAKKKTLKFSSWTEAVSVLETHKAPELRKLAKTLGVKPDGRSKKSHVWALAAHYCPPAKKAKQASLTACVTDTQSTAGKVEAKAVLARVASEAPSGFAAALAAAAEARATAKAVQPGRRRRPAWRAWGNFIKALIEAGDKGLTLDELVRVEVADLTHEGITKTAEQVKGGIRWRPNDLGILLRFFGIGDIVKDGKRYVLVTDRGADAKRNIQKALTDDVDRVLYNAKHEVRSYGKHLKSE